MEGCLLQKYSRHREDKLENFWEYYYHGLRLGSLDKLKSILKYGGIYSINKNPSPYLWTEEIGFNGLDYISLFQIETSVVHTRYQPYTVYYYDFIIKNISLVVKGDIEVYETFKPEKGSFKFESDAAWYQYYNTSTERRYSDLPGEVQVKDQILLKDIVALGFPLKAILNDDSFVSLDSLKEIKKILKEYNVNWPIVDTSNFNKLVGEDSIKLKVK